MINNHPVVNDIVKTWVQELKDDVEAGETEQVSCLFKISALRRTTPKVLICANGLGMPRPQPYKTPPK